VPSARSAGSWRVVTRYDLVAVRSGKIQLCRIVARIQGNGLLEVVDRRLVLSALEGLNALFQLVACLELGASQSSGQEQQQSGATSESCATFHQKPSLPVCGLLPLNARYHCSYRCFVGPAVRLYRAVDASCQSGCRLKAYREWPTNATPHSLRRRTFSRRRLTLQEARETLRSHPQGKIGRQHMGGVTR